MRRTHILTHPDVEGPIDATYTTTTEAYSCDAHGEDLPIGTPVFEVWQGDDVAEIICADHVLDRDASFTIAPA